MDCSKVGRSRTFVAAGNKKSESKAVMTVMVLISARLKAMDCVSSLAALSLLMAALSGRSEQQEQQAEELRRRQHRDGKRLLLLLLLLLCRRKQKEKRTTKSAIRLFRVSTFGRQRTNYSRDGWMDRVLGCKKIRLNRTNQTKRKASTWRSL